MKRTQAVSEEQRQKKRRVMESSDEESEEEDENKQTNERRDGETKITAAKNRTTATSEPSCTEQTSVSKTIGQKRKVTKEATRRSTRQRKGVDKMGGVMIYRIECK